jgi:hypothetical protein
VLHRLLLAGAEVPREFTAVADEEAVEREAGE